MTMPPNNKTTAEHLGKVVGSILIAITFGSACIGFGRQVGRVDSMESNQDKILSLLNEFIGQGNRSTFEDAVDQHSRSYKKFVENPNGFWLAEPIHIDRNPHVIKK